MDGASLSRVGSRVVGVGHVAATLEPCAAPPLALGALPGWNKASENVPDGVHGSLHVRVDAEVGVEFALPAAEPEPPLLAPEQERRGNVVVRAVVIRHQADADVPAVVLVALHPPRSGQPVSGLSDLEALGPGQAGVRAGLVVGKGRKGDRIHAGISDLALGTAGRTRGADGQRMQQSP